MTRECSREDRCLLHLRRILWGTRAYHSSILNAFDKTIMCSKLLDLFFYEICFRKWVLFIHCFSSRPRPYEKQVRYSPKTSDELKATPPPLFRPILLCSTTHCTTTTQLSNHEILNLDTASFIFLHPKPIPQLNRQDGSPILRWR